MKGFFVKMDFIDSPKLKQLKNIVITAGHYGSGKTNVAVNLAVAFAKNGFTTAIADLDIVNPYFRTADSAKFLENQGISCLAGEYANTNVDIPTLPFELPSLFLRKSNEYRSVLDVGGDEGAVALGMFCRQIEECGYDMLYVINSFRPLTADPHDAADLLRDIENASRLKCSYIVNNSNIGYETSAEDVKNSETYANEVSALTGLPLLFNSYIGDITNSVPDTNSCSFNMVNATKQIF